MHVLLFVLRSSDDASQEEQLSAGALRDMSNNPTSGKYLWVNPFMRLLLMSNDW